MINRTTYRSGLVGQSSSNARVTIYTQARSNTPDTIPCDGRSERDAHPCIIGVQMQSDLTAGQMCNVLLKANFDLVEYVQDDDWIDVALTSGAREWHVFRGSIDEVRETVVTSATGATTNAYQVVARGFQKVWQITPMWLENSLGVNNGEIEIDEVFNDLTSEQRSVSQVVYSFLYRYFIKMVAGGRSGLNVPASMARALPLLPYQPSSSPGQRPLVSLNSGEGFIEYDDSGYNTTINQRLGIAQSYCYPDAALWDAARQWADPVYCELFTDLMPQGGLAKLRGQVNPLADGFPIAASQMTCVVRDKPFVIGSRALTYAGLYRQLPNLASSAWFELPKYLIPQQVVVQTNLGKSGFERYNAFYTALQGARSGATGDGNRPEWDTDSLKRHGLRRFDGQTRYAPVVSSVSSLEYFASRKQQVRDWYALGGDFLQGTIGLGCALPGLRLGSRLHLRCANNASDLHGYIENFSHMYQPGSTPRTTIGLTRGYRGDEKRIIDMVDQATANYHEADRGDAPTQG